MTSSLSSPLTDADRRHIALLLDTRTRLAKKLTLIVALIDALFCVRLWAAGATHSNGPSMLAIGVVVTAALALLVANVGWGLVIRLQRDLRAGVKQATKGTIRGLVRVPSNYGETTTRLTVGAEELMTKGAAFALVKDGETMSVEYLPLSREVLKATLLDGEPG
jgi:hypothetical protein